MPRSHADAVDLDAALQRELHSFALYRVLEAALLALVVFSPAGALIDTPAHLGLGRAVAVAYLTAGLLFLLTTRGGFRLRTQALLGIAVDIVVAVLATHALPESGSGIALMLLFNVGAAALLLPLSLGMGAAVLAAAGLVAQQVFATITGMSPQRPLAELLMFAVSFLAIATLTHLFARQMRASHVLAEQRGLRASSMAEINELIIRRMRTGVLLVDGDDHLRLANEAALAQLGGPAEAQPALATAAPELARRLRRWRAEGNTDDAPIRFASDQTEVIPRFTRLLADQEHVLVFLDDASMLSRRAESMTLATLGRFSASLAHEIRNPLAAINYAAQLLEESPDIPTSDRRMLEIIHQQCMRMNAIVENVLGLARRERAQPEHVDLVAIGRRFVEEYLASHPIEGDILQLRHDQGSVPALADPRQLHQVLTALVSNALAYGRVPGEPARVTVHVRGGAGAPTVDVLDRGPGMPESVAAQLFRPFFTTSEHGTGLGLYIARELCRANQASLEHVAMPGGGTCFRIRLPAPHALLPA
ncbi:HAMP domain-containing sensor histidine kinase [Luteimonas pelagia]